MTTMIFVRDKGRMCNNILQYGHLYAWGREHGRSTMSMRFAYKYRYFHICDTRYHSFLWYVVAKYAAKWGLLSVVSFDEESGVLPEKEEQLKQHSHIVAQGWYARWYNLFLKHKDEIRSLFAFHDDIEHQVAPLLHDGLRLGVHIRRGDYATFQGGRFLYTDSQYAAVIRQFLEFSKKGKKVTIYICGNDPKLDRDYFRRTFSDCEVCFPDGNPGEDLCLLSHCDYLIGAPSTFTLVASMYHDTPLYWIEDPETKVTKNAFGHFDTLFQRIY